MSTHTEMLIGVLQKRLQQLELQRAGFGPLYAPAHILTDIEQTRAEIAQLGQQRVQQLLRLQALRTPRPAPMPGLIVLVSPRRATELLAELSAYAAIEHHRGALKHCWMLATSGDGGSFDTAQELAQHFGHYNLASSIWQVSDPASIAETFALVDWIYAQRVPASGLSEAEVIADITGGTKPMTAGMVFACGRYRAMQYMVFQQGGPSLPIKLEVQAPGAGPALLNIYP